MRKILLGLALLGTVFAAGAAHAVSDGNYSYSMNGCSGHANDSDHPTYTEQHCHNIAVVVYDGSGHQYFGIGMLQTPDGTPIHDGEWWADLGDGTRTTQHFDIGLPNGDPPSADDPVTSADGATPAHPETGIHVYFGVDDNVDVGEHDGSEQIANGPSDGGGIQANLDPSTVEPWLSHLMAADPSFLLTHPLPLADAGMGFCVDGICVSIQTQRRVAYQGQNPNASRDVANYDGTKWDPEPCDGPDDGVGPCGPGAIAHWNSERGTTYVEPGVQIYEDPDPQASPAALSFLGVPPEVMRDPYPIPSLYIGTCGIEFGGGTDPSSPTWMPDSPFTNDAGQAVIPTAC
jgi:hypothetical protein